MSQTAAILKLKQAGEFAIIAIDRAEPLKFGEYPEVEFSGYSDEGQLVALRVPQKSADRQLERLSLSYADCEGKTLKFSRDPNNKDASKPYWGINVVQGSGAKTGGPVSAGGQPKATSAEVNARSTAANHPAPVTRKQVEQALDAEVVEFSDPLYLAITRFVLNKVSAVYEVESPNALTPEVAAAISATIYINAKRNG
jgi:hypothetical protein